MDILNFDISAHLLHVPIINCNIHHILLNYIFVHNYVSIDISEYYDLCHSIFLHIYFCNLLLDMVLCKNDQYFDTYVYLYDHIIKYKKKLFFRFHFKISLFLFCNLDHHKALYIYDLYCSNIIPHDLYFLRICHNIQNILFNQIGTT